MNERVDRSEDPRLSAFACDELQGAERELVARFVAEDPAARAAVNELRETAAALRAALASEASPGLSTARRAVIEQMARAAASAEQPQHQVAARRRAQWRPRAWLALAVAAGLALTVTLRVDPSGDSSADTLSARLELPPEAPAPGLLAAGATEPEAVQVSAAAEAPSAPPLPAMDSEPSTLGALEESWAKGEADGLKVGRVAPHQLAVLGAEDPAGTARGQDAAAASGLLEAPGPLEQATAPGAPREALLGAVPDAARPRAEQDQGAMRSLVTPKAGGARGESPFVAVALQAVTPIALAVGRTDLVELERSLADRARGVGRGAVQIEALLNTFPCASVAPTAKGEHPLAVHTAVTRAPWQPAHRLVHVTLTLLAKEPSAPRALSFADVELEVAWDAARAGSVRLFGDAPAAELAPGAAADAAPGATGASRGGAASTFVALLEVSQAPGAEPGRMGTLRVRYVRPSDGVRQSFEVEVRDTGAAFAEASDDTRFAAAVAAFGMVLGDSPFRGTATPEEVRSWAAGALGTAHAAARAKLIELAELAAQK